MKKMFAFFLLFISFASAMSQTLSTVPNGLRLISPSHYSYGCAAASDGTVYFTEFNRQQLRQVNTNGTISVRRMGLSGMFGIAMDASNNIFVGRDLGDVGNPSKITKITQAGVETDIVTGITRPRQLTTDATGNVYFSTESPSRISRWNKASGTVDILVSGLSYAAEGVAVATDGTIYFSEYGDPQAGVAGTVKKRATNGTITTLVNTNIWRCRGLIINSANDYLYLCTEADQADHGNSGLLAKIKISDGTWTKALEGIDYPQFPSVASNGNIYFTLTRESWLAMYNPTATTTESNWSGNGDVKIGVSEGTWTSGGAGTALNIKVGNALVLSGNVSASVTNGTVHGWIRIPENLIVLDTSELYTPCYPAEHPTPGIFRLPKVIYEANTGSCLISVIALRDHIGQRWPMQNIGTCNESPAAGFSEKPLDYLVYFAWNNTDRINTILSPSYSETGNVTNIIKGSEPGWIYSGTPFSSSSQTWLNAGKYNSTPASSSWAEQDLGAFSGKSKYIYVMWHKNGPYRPNAAKVRLYDYTEEKSLITSDQTKYANNLDYGDDRFSGWLLVGQKKVNITPSTKLLIYQDDPVGATEYLQSDAILLSDYPIFDNTSLGAATDFENNPALSVTSSGSTGVGSHWGMQGIGYQYTTTNGKSFAATIDANVIFDLPYGSYYVEVSWDYLNTDAVNVTNAKYSVNGTATSDVINQNRSSTNQGGAFAQGNSVGTWSGFYRLNGTFSHSAGSSLTVNSSYSTALYGTKRFVFDMVRFVPAFSTQYRSANNNTAATLKDDNTFLINNYPNPFKSVTTLNYSIPQDGVVSVKVFTANGSEIVTLVNEYKMKGAYRINFNKGTLKAGLYFSLISINGKFMSKKMILL